MVKGNLNSKDALIKVALKKDFIMDKEKWYGKMAIRIKEGGKKVN
jgi:hypothetical protein